MSYNDDFLILPDNVLSKMANEYYSKLNDKFSSQSQQKNIKKVADIMSDSFISLQQLTKSDLPVIMQNTVMQLEQTLKLNKESLSACYDFLPATVQNRQINTNIFNCFCNILEGINLLFDIVEVESKIYNKNILIKMQKNTITALKTTLLCLNESNVKIYKHF